MSSNLYYDPLTDAEVHALIEACYSAIRDRNAKVAKAIADDLLRRRPFLREVGALQIMVAENTRRIEEKH